jgi:KDO2-lipid IV(A) lauroyltransferase
VVPLLPERWLPWLAKVLGTGAFLLAARARRVARMNAEAVLGQGCATDTLWRMFVNNAQYYLSLFARRPASFRLEDHQLDGWEHFSEALARGRGCLLVSPHVGDINYYAELFVTSGLPMNVLVEEIRPKRLCELVTELRRRRGVNVIVGGRGALGEIYRALDRNEIVAIISDRDVAGDGQRVCFFGRETKLPHYAFTIGARRKTPIVFGAAVRLDGNRIVADVRAPFVPSADIQAEVQRMARVFEEFIRRWPDQWLAFQPVFHG